MSIYLYNLGFSTSNVLSGNFSVGGSGINASNAWFQFNGSGNPAGINNYQGVIPSLGSASNWSPLSAPPASFNSAQTGSGDYLFLRIFNSDGAPGNYLVRTTVIVGQGDSVVAPVSSQLQSPFVKNSAYQPMPVIDCDTVAFSAPGVPTWPGPVTDNNPITAASSWAYCLGQVNGPTNYYTFNVGASVYVTQGSGVGSTYAFGIDPRMKVNGMSRVAEDAA